MAIKKDVEKSPCRIHGNIHETLGPVDEKKPASLPLLHGKTRCMSKVLHANSYKDAAEKTTEP